MITTNIIIDKDAFLDLPTDKNVMVEIKMIVKGETFHKAFTIEEFQGMKTETMLSEFDYKLNLISRTFQNVFNSRKDLKPDNNIITRCWWLPK